MKNMTDNIMHAFIVYLQIYTRIHVKEVVDNTCCPMNFQYFFQ